ncbi:MAG: phage portal protein [Rikenellaceae bacterium]
MAKSKITVTNRTDPYMQWGTMQSSNDKFWRWGDDNLFPSALSTMSRRAPIHRRIINDKADYIAGKGFSMDPDAVALAAFVESVNASGESMRQLLSKLAFDKSLFGNAFVEVVADDSHTTLSLFHHDASMCRVAKDSQHVIIHSQWERFDIEEAQVLPIFPLFERDAEGRERSMIHYKDYEPMFEHYGVPPYIAGLNVAAIAYKTDRWNMSRLDNSFQMSGVMLLDNAVDSEEQADEVIRTAQQKFGGKPGQVLFVVKDGSENDNSRFIPISSSEDGDWYQLHEQALSDIVVAHSWFRSLSGLDYSSGLSAERIMYEYEIALNTVILAEQAELLEPIMAVIEYGLGIDASSLAIINQPPTQSKPSYMMVWEARKADGLEFDSEDPRQQIFLAELN